MAVGSKIIEPFIALFTVWFIYMDAKHFRIGIQTIITNFSSLKQFRNKLQIYGAPLLTKILNQAIIIDGVGIFNTVAVLPVATITNMV